MRSYTIRETKQEIKDNTSQVSLLQIGLALKEAREKRSFSLKDIRDITCIPTNHLVAIENGNRAELPEDFYLMGFIKRYARAVGINENIKGSSPSYGIDAFDVLFKEDYKTKEPKIINLKKKGGHKDSEIFKEGFLKGYHFYFFIGVILFVAAIYLIFQTLRTNSYNSMPATTFVIEDGKPVYIEKSKNTDKSENVIEDEDEDEDEEMPEDYKGISWGEEGQSQVTSFKSQVAKPKLQATSLKPPVARPKQQVTSFKSQVAKSKPQVINAKPNPKPIVKPVQKSITKPLPLPPPIQIQQKKNTELMLRPLKIEPGN